MKKLMAALLCAAGLVGRAGAASGPQWVEVDSPHFAVVTDAGESQARRLAAQLERMRAVFRDVLPYAAGDAVTPIRVLAVRNEREFAGFESRLYLDKGSTKFIGFFRTAGDHNYILLRLDGESSLHPNALVYHEYTHFILRRANLPAWLDEGLAQFYERTDIHENDARFGEPDMLKVGQVRRNRMIPLTVLFQVRHTSPYYHDADKTGQFYAESWALVHMIESEDFPVKRHRLQDYSQNLANGEDSVAAGRHAFGDLNLLQKQLDDYIGQGLLGMFAIKKSYPTDAAAYPARSLTGTTAAAFRADVLATNGRQIEAEELLKRALAEEPKNVLALETMGALNRRQHDLAGAVKWFGDAVASDPNDYFAQYSFGLCTAALGDPSKNEKAEESLRKAIELQPDFAPAYDELEHLLVAEKKDLSEARMLGVRAVQLEPQELNYRLGVADTLVVDENYETANQVLKTADKEQRGPRSIMSEFKTDWIASGLSKLTYDLALSKKLLSRSRV